METQEQARSWVKCFSRVWPIYALQIVAFCWVLGSGKQGRLGIGLLCGQGNCSGALPLSRLSRSPQVDWRREDDFSLDSLHWVFWWLSLQMEWVLGVALVSEGTVGDGPSAHRGSRPGAGEMAHCFRALVAFPEDLGSIPSTYITANNYLQLQF